MIGKRLKLARVSAGMSLRELESGVGERVSAQAIGKYERDEMMPSSDVLMTLAHALGVSEMYLVGQGDIELERVDFRKNSVGSKKEDAQIKALVLERVQRYLEIEEILGLESKTWEKPKWAPFPMKHVADAERAAQVLRTEWNLGDDAVPSIAELMEDHGIKVLVLPELSESISGIAAHVVGAKAENVRVVVIRQGDTGDRQRFTLCHELGHLLLESNPDVDEEKAAHRFAAAFLMPELVIQKEIGRHRRAVSVAELVELKPKFGVSAQALAYRLRELDIITPAHLKSLFEQFVELGWRKHPFKEPKEWPSENPSRFKRLCMRALSEEIVSESKGAELLRLRVRDLDGFFNAMATQASCSP